MRRVAIALLAAACGSDPVLAPIIESPPAGAAAYPWDDVDTLRLSITRGGEEIERATAPRDQRPQLDGIPFGDDLVVHLLGLRAGAEVAYGRTCAVSFPLAGRPPPRLFFSRIVRWSDAVAPAVPQRDAATTTPDGAALFFGGDTVERFDPVSGSFVTLDDRVVARAGAAAAVLVDGSVLRVGGLVDGAPAEGFELVNPGGDVVAVDDPRLQLVGHAAATLSDNQVVVIGGELTEGEATSTTGVTWLFTPSVAADRPRRLAARLATPRRDHTLTRLGDAVGAAVLVAGGRDAAGSAVAAAELYDPQAESYLALRPAMVAPRYDHRAVRLPDGSVLILGGRDASGAPLTKVELYRPVAAEFTDAGDLPDGAGLTGASATVLPDGRILVAGGRDAAGDPVATAYIARLDPIGGRVDFSPTAPLAAARADHAAARLCDGTVLVVGGGPLTAERYNPPSAGRQ